MTPRHTIKTDKTEVDLAVAINDIATIKKDVGEIKTKLENNYVTQEEFKWVRNIVYGMIGLLSITVFIALIKLVIAG